MTNFVLTENSKRPSSGLLIFVTIVITTLSIAMVVCAIWGRNRGICITDESSCILQCIDPLRYALAASNWHFMASKLPPLSAHTISNYRLWHLVLHIAGAAALSFGFYRFVRLRYATPGPCFFLSLFGVVLIANLLDLSCYPLALSYNSMLNFLSCCAAGCFLYGVSKVDAGLKPALTALFLSGFFNGLCFFVKPPSCASTLLLLSVATIASWKHKSAFILVASQYFGSLIAFATFFLCFENIQIWWRHISEAAQAMQQSGRLVNTLLEKSLNGFAPAITQFCFNFVPLALLAFGISHYLQRRRQSGSQKLALILIILAFGLEIFICGYFQPGAKSVGVYYGIALVLAAFLLGANAGKPKSVGDSLDARQLFGCMGFLACLPFAESFGTGNAIIGHTIIHMAPWFLFVILLSFELASRLQSRATVFLSLLFLSTVAAGQFFSGYLNTPYGMALSMQNQRLSTDLPGIKGQKLSSAERNFLERTYSLLVESGFQEGDTVLAFYNLPGVLLAAKANSVSVPAYFPEPAQEAMLCMALNSLKEKEPRLFVLESWEISPDVRQVLTDKGYDFPAKFKLVGSTTNPCGDPSMFRKNMNKKYLDCRVNVYAYNP